MSHPSSTLPYQAACYPHLLPVGVGFTGSLSPAISRNLVSMEVKYFRILETPLSVREMLKLVK